MSIGKLKNKVVIQQPGTTRDAGGQKVPSWTTLANVWADIRFPSGLQAIKADAPSSIVRASVRIRARADVQPGMRVVSTVGTLDIKAVLPNLEDRRYVDLTCEQVTNG